MQPLGRRHTGRTDQNDAIEAIDRNILDGRVAWNSREAAKATLSYDLIGPNCYECPPRPSAVS
jgi:hypothetical protein